MTSFEKTLKEARELMDRGKFREASARITDIRVSRPDQFFAKIALIVDAGVALRDIKLLEYGNYLMDFHSRDILVIPAYVPFHWMNLGNLKANILALKEHEGTTRCWYSRPSTLPIRKAYINAFNGKTASLHLESLILCVHGRLLLGLGRDNEAFELFHKAVLLDPENGESELGRTIALTALAGTVPAFERDLLKEAGERLSRLEWSDGVSEIKMRITERLGTADAGTVEYPKNEMEVNTQDYDMVKFFIRHRLYLSPCSMCQRCDRSIGDSIAIGVKHAVIGGKISGRYRRMTLLMSRLTERYNALRSALFNHCHNSDVPIEETVGLTPIPPSTVHLISLLSGLWSVMEGMAAYIALYLDKQTAGSVSLPQIIGTPSAPESALMEAKNPALHAFWDLWADGVEGMIPGFDLIGIFGDSMSTPQVESLSLNYKELTDQTMSLLVWLGKLIFYLVRMVDRDAQGDTKDPPLWSLESFLLPEIPLT